MKHGCSCVDYKLCDPSLISIQQCVNILVVHVSSPPPPPKERWTLLLEQVVAGKGWLVKGGW